MTTQPTPVVTQADVDSARKWLCAANPDNIKALAEIMASHRQEATRQLVEALDDCIATLAAVRAATSDEGWEESREHYYLLCGNSIAFARKAIEVCHDII